MDAKAAVGLLVVALTCVAVAGLLWPSQPEASFAESRDDENYDLVPVELGGEVYVSPYAGSQ